QVISPPSTSLRLTMKPFETCAGRVKMPSAISRSRSFGLKPFSCPGLNAVRILDGRATPPGRPHEEWHSSSPPCAGRRRLGLSLPRESQPASAATPGKGTQANPRYQLEGADTTVQTLPTAERQREKCQPGGWRHRAGTECIYVGYCPGGSADAVARDS